MSERKSSLSNIQEKKNNPSESKNYSYSSYQSSTKNTGESSNSSYRSKNESNTKVMTEKREYRRTTEKTEEK